MTAPNLVQVVNIEDVLQTHLWCEIDAVNAKIDALTTQAAQLAERRAMLLEIARVAGVQRADDTDHNREMREIRGV